MYLRVYLHERREGFIAAKTLSASMYANLIASFKAFGEKKS